MLQEPDVGGVADPGAADDKIEDGAEAASGPDWMRIALKHERECEIGEAGKSDLPGGGTKGIDRARLPFFGKHGAQGPTERASLQSETPPELAAAERGGMNQVGPDEDGDAGNSNDEADFAAAGNVMVAEQKAIEHEKPERTDGNEESGEAGGDDLLGEGKSEVASHEEQDADHGEMREFARRETDLTPGNSAIGEHDHAGDSEAGRAHEGGRNLLDGNADAEIG